MGENNVAAVAALGFSATLAGEMQAAIFVDGPAGRDRVAQVTAPAGQGRTVKNDDITFLVHREGSQVHLRFHHLGVLDGIAVHLEGKTVHGGFFADKSSLNGLFLGLVAAGRDGQGSCQDKKCFFHILCFVYLGMSGSDHPSR